MMPCQWVTWVLAHKRSMLALIEKVVTLVAGFILSSHSSDHPTLQRYQVREELALIEIPSSFKFLVGYKPQEKLGQMFCAQSNLSHGLCPT